MKRKQEIGLEFEIDKLTNSIQNIITGDSFTTEIILINSISELKVTVKKNGWQFNWKNELKQPQREVYKLSITNNLNIIQGLISLELKSDHVYMHLIESSPFNKGREKVYAGVPGNLVAFACKLSFQRGHDGNVSFVAKSQLIKHYEQSLEATHIGGRIMIIGRIAALKLTNKYFANEK